MTMHLLSHAFNSNNTKKRKSKITKVTPELTKAFKEHNKQMKSLGLKVKTMEDYIAYRQGNYDPKLGAAVVIPSHAKSLQRVTPQLPSGNIVDVSLAVKPKEYTGTLIKGIATMHKSNAVPVISKEAAEEIAKMRR